MWSINGRKKISITWSWFSLFALVPGNRLLTLLLFSQAVGKSQLASSWLSEVSTGHRLSMVGHSPFLLDVYRYVWCHCADIELFPGTAAQDRLVEC